MAYRKISHNNYGFLLTTIFLLVYTAVQGGVISMYRKERTPIESATGNIHIIRLHETVGREDIAQLEKEFSKHIAAEG